MYYQHAQMVRRVGVYRGKRGYSGIEAIEKGDKEMEKKIIHKEDSEILNIQKEEVSEMLPVTEQKKITTAAEEVNLARRERILSVLARAADDSKFLAQLADDPARALSDYYTLKPEEVAALASGDIRKIEGWLGKLDKRHATWLWCRLCQEKW